MHLDYKKDQQRRYRYDFPMGRTNPENLFQGIMNISRLSNFIINNCYDTQNFLYEDSVAEEAIAILLEPPPKPALKQPPPAAEQKFEELYKQIFQGSTIHVIEGAAITDLNLTRAPSQDKSILDDPCSCLEDSQNDSAFEDSVTDSPPENLVSTQVIINGTSSQSLEPSEVALSITATKVEQSLANLPVSNPQETSHLVKKYLSPGSISDSNPGSPVFTRSKNAPVLSQDIKGPKCNLKTEKQKLWSDAQADIFKNFTALRNITRCNFDRYNDWVDTILEHYPNIQVEGLMSRLLGMKVSTDINEFAFDELKDIFNGIKTAKNDLPPEAEPAVNLLLNKFFKLHLFVAPMDLNPSLYDMNKRCMPTNEVLNSITRQMLMKISLFSNEIVELQRFNWLLAQQFTKCKKLNNEYGDFTVKHFKGITRFLQFSSNMMLNQWLLFTHEALEYGTEVIEEMECAYQHQRSPNPIHSPNKLIEKLVNIRDEHCFSLCLLDFDEFDDDQ